MTVQEYKQQLNRVNKNFQSNFLYKDNSYNALIAIGLDPSDITFGFRTKPYNLYVLTNSQLIYVDESTRATAYDLRDAALISSSNGLVFSEVTLSFGGEVLMIKDITKPDFEQLLHIVNRSNETLNKNLEEKQKETMSSQNNHSINQKNSKTSTVIKLLVALFLFGPMLYLFFSDSVEDTIYQTANKDAIIATLKKDGLSSSDMELLLQAVEAEKNGLRAISGQTIKQITIDQRQINRNKADAERQKKIDLETKIKDVLAQMNTVVSKIELDETLNDLNGEGTKGYRISTDRVKLIAYVKDNELQSIRYADEDYYSNGNILKNLSDYTINSKEASYVAMVVRHRIMGMLNDPDSASFPSDNEWGYTKTPTEIKTSAWVRAKNGFGATIKKNFSATLTPDGETVTSISGI